MNGILIYWCCSEQSELFHTFKGFITYLHVVILSCMLLSIYGHILSFLSIYIYNNLAPSGN